MSAEKTIPYIHPKDFLVTATPINDIINGLEIVWLVDFDLQIASSASRLMYERKDWMGSCAPNQKMFTAFLTAQQSKAKKKTETLHDFLTLKEGIKLTPIYEDLNHSSFRIGFIIGKSSYLVSSKVFTANSEVAEFLDAEFEELSKVVLSEPESVQAQSIKLNPDRVSVSPSHPYSAGQWQACTSWVGVNLIAVGYSPEEARAELDREFQETVVSLADTSFTTFEKTETVQLQDLELKPAYIQVYEHSEDALCRYKAICSIDGSNDTKLRLARCGTSKEKAIDNLQKAFCRIIKAVTIQSSDLSNFAGAEAV